MLPASLPASLSWSVSPRARAIWLLVVVVAMFQAEARAGWVLPIDAHGGLSGWDCLGTCEISPVVGMRPEQVLPPTDELPLDPSADPTPRHAASPAGGSGSSPAGGASVSTMGLDLWWDTPCIIPSFSPRFHRLADKALQWPPHPLDDLLRPPRFVSQERSASAHTF
jgi:hypothetical protein